jgi:hypothetical protein
MWSKFIVTATSRHSRETRSVEIGCMGEAEALTYRRIWFPPERYSGHTTRPKRHNHEKG